MPSTPSANAITCPLCIGVTGRARTAPELRFAEPKPFTFNDTTVEVVPCEPCRENHGRGLVSVTLRKSRVIELAWSSDFTPYGFRNRFDRFVSFG